MKTSLLLLMVTAGIQSGIHAQRWPVDKANNWYTKQGWLVGANFIPSTAINQLEMWQAETFDTATIDRELGYAENIGMNCMRVYLHHVAWVVDAGGFKQRIRQYLNIASRHGIKTMFVLFDDCWRDTYTSGVQPLPIPGKHNSGWLKDPGNRVQEAFVLDSMDIWYTESLDERFHYIKKNDRRFNRALKKQLTLVDTLQAYVTDILTTFKKDKRILLWDLYNEPGQFDQHEKSLPLLKAVFAWARAAKVSQPLSAGLHDDGEVLLNRFQLDNSDIITYHSYDSVGKHQFRIDSLRRVCGGRPLICTEYMARKRGSTFAVILPMLKREKIGAINWGLTDGKTQTKYAWDEKQYSDGSEPGLWFHDVFRKDGTPYKTEEAETIRRATKDR